MVQYVPDSLRSVIPFSLLCSDPILSPPSLSPPSGSLAADWVVIVIKSSCTARESTKLSANGWSFWWEGGLEKGHGHCPTEPPPTQCLPVFF